MICTYTHWRAIVKPGTHWQQSWIQRGRLCWKSTVAETGSNSAQSQLLSYTFNFVADTCNFVAGSGNKSATTWIRQLVVVDFVADMVDFVASVYDFPQSRPCWIRLCRWCVPGFTDDCRFGCRFNFCVVMLLLTTASLCFCVFSEFVTW